MRRWRIHYFRTSPSAGYYKFVRAWTKRGALRKSDWCRHTGWLMLAERWRGEEG